MIDTDELLVPAANITLPEFLERAEREKTDFASFDAISFMNVYYGAYVSNTLPHRGHFILGTEWRALKPMKQRE